jgi:hypothetical protein
MTNELDIHQAGRQAFLGITEDWGLTIDDQCTLLGNMPRSTFMTMKQNPAYQFNHDQLERISYIMGIHKALRILPIGHAKENIRRWLREPQQLQYARIFGGKSALEKMLNGSVWDLAEVRSYLENFHQ